MILRLDVLKDAVYDYSFLLNRGYPSSEALRLVTSRYRLASVERLALQRCVHPWPLSLEIRGKLVSIPHRCMYVDGYNQIATVYAALQGLPVFRCSDGLTRDVLSGRYNRARAIMLVAPLLRELLDRLSNFVENVVILFDSRISHSGIHAKFLRSYLKSLNLVVYVVTSRRVDASLIAASLKRGCTIASSDVVVASKAGRVYDLASAMLKLAGLKAINISDLSYEAHVEWCRGPVAQPG